MKEPSQFRLGFLFYGAEPIFFITLIYTAAYEKNQMYHH